MLKMIALFALIIFFGILSVIKKIEGWKKVLKILVIWGLSVAISVIALEGFKVSAEDPIYQIIGSLVLGGWAVAIIFYSYFKGYIGKS